MSTDVENWPYTVYSSDLFGILRMLLGYGEAGTVLAVGDEVSILALTDSGADLLSRLGVPCVLTDGDDILEPGCV